MDSVYLYVHGNVSRDDIVAWLTDAGLHPTSLPDERLNVKIHGDAREQTLFISLEHDGHASFDGLWEPFRAIMIALTGTLIYVDYREAWALDPLLLALQPAISRAVVGTDFGGYFALSEFGERAAAYPDWATRRVAIWPD